MRAALFAGTALTALAIIAAAAPARADDIQSIEFQIVGISANGAVLIGQDTSTGRYEAVRWSGGVATHLGTLTGDPGWPTNSFPLGNNSVSADGSVVIGLSDFFVGGLQYQHGFRWAGGVMTDLGTLGGRNSFVSAVSADGTTVVGAADTPTTQHAFRWVGGTMTDLGDLMGGVGVSDAKAVSADGSVVAGSTSVNGFSAWHVYRWTAGGGMVDLGTLGGTYADVAGISADGSVVVGLSFTAGDAATHAYRWTGGTMTDLGTLGGTSSGVRAVSSNGAAVIGDSDIAGDGAKHAYRWAGGTMTDLGVVSGATHSFAYAVSADGSVVVGSSGIPSHPHGPAGFSMAYRWTAATGMRPIADLLTAAGVNMTGWQLQAATGVSADGTIIVGYGSNPNDSFQSWIARIALPDSTGIITIPEIMHSFSSLGALGQTGNAALGNTLGTITEIATQGGNNQGGNTPYSVFGYGGYDSDPAASGTLGLTVKLPDQMKAGALVSANYVRTNMVYDGNAKMLGGSAGVFLARAPDAGLQWLVAATGITLKGDVSRGYLNGNSPTSSQGNTTGNGLGATGRIGWSFDRLLPQTQVTPFASYTISRMRFNGYTESGGPFPAQFDSFNDTAQTTRFGADARYTFAPGKWLWGTLASAHRLNSSKSADITGTLIGLFGLTAPAGPVAKDWIETTAGVRWPLWTNGALTASLTAAIPTNYPTTYQARVGVTQAF